MGLTPEQFDEMRNRTEAAIARGKSKHSGVIIDPLKCDETAKSIIESIPVVKSAKRIRQNEKPLMNKLESDWFNILNAQFPNFPRPRAQAKTYRLANGTKFTPDVTASIWPDAGGPAKETAWEVKGKHSWDDSIVKLKVAASVWPEVNWWLCWKVKGVWQTQKILP